MAAVIRHQPLHRLCRARCPEIPSPPARDRTRPRWSLQHALDDGAQVGGRLEIAALIEVGGLEAGPVGDDAAALHRAAGEQRDRAGAVIGAVGAVDARGAAELGGDHDHGVAPALAEPAFEFGERAVEAAEQQCARRPTGPPSLAWVSQPSKASAAMRGPSSAAISLAAPRATCRICADLVAGLRLHVVAAARPSPAEGPATARPPARDRGDDRDRRGASRCRRRLAAAPPAPSRRSAHCRAAPAAWSARPQEPLDHPLAARQRFQRAIEPAGLHAAGPGIAAFEHVLAVEMRAVAIGRRHRMDHRGMLVAIHARKFRHRRMQREERIQHDRRMRAVRGERDRPVQAGIVGIADRRDGREPIERAAQDHHDQPRIAAVGRAREFRQISPGRERRAAEQEAAARGEEPALARSRSSSSPLHFRRHQQQRQRLLPRFRALDGSPRFDRGRIGRGEFQQVARIDVGAEPRGDLRRDVEPELHAFGRGPGRIGIGKAVRAGRRPQRLAQQIEAAEIAAGILRHAREQPAGRDQEIVRAAHLGQRRLPGLVGIDQRRRQRLEIAVGLEEDVAAAAPPAPAADRRPRNGGRIWWR